MGKDRNGKYQPPKGKPSGAGKEEGLGLHPTDPEKIDQYIDISNKYTTDADSLAEHVPLRHPNRNTEKGHNGFKNQQDAQDGAKRERQNFSEDRTPVVAEEIPGFLTKDVFSELADYTADNCVSFFIDTHAAGVEVNEQFDPVKFKNRLQDVANKLKGKGLAQPEITRLLEPGYELLRQDDFWRKLSPGLAVFIADGYFKYIKMPLSPAVEETIIETSFFVTPLVPILTSEEYFYLLVISKQCAKLFKGDAFGLQKVPVDLPQSIEDVKRISGLDATTFRSGSSGSRAPRYAQEGSYHGTGGGNPDGKDNMLVYFEAVDDILWDEVLHNENAPLLLACVEYEAPIYRKACDYKNVWPVSLTGNYERTDTATLYREAKEAMKPHFEQRMQKALELYGNQSATMLTADTPKDIIPATYYSRVSHLFVQRGAHIWGKFDDMSSELNLHEGDNDGGENLVDHAVVQTLMTGGEVYLLDKEQMPGKSPLAAILRY